MLRLLSVLTVVSLALNICGSQESYAKSAVKKTKKAAVTAKVTKTDKKFSELDSNKTDRSAGTFNDLHSVPLTGRVLQSR